MTFRTNIRVPAATALFSTTSTTLATLTVPAVDGKRVCVTGVDVSYGTAFTTAVTPSILDGSTVIMQIGNVLTATSVQFFFPICGSTGNAVSFRTTVSTASVANLGIRYFYDT